MSETKNEALARREAAELATIPEWMRGDEEAVALNMDFRQEDITLPRLAIAQSLTPQKKKSCDNYVPGLEDGDLFNTLTGQVYAKAGETVKFVVLANWTENIYFDGNGGVKCRARDGKGCSMNRGGPCCNSGWREGSGKDAKPLCTEFLNFIARELETGGYIILSFKSTGLKAARQGIVAKLRVGQKGIADFAKIFEMGVKLVGAGTPQEYYVPVIKRAVTKIGADEVGAVIDDRDLYDELKAQCTALRDRKSAVKVHEDGLDESELPNGDKVPF